MNSKDFMDLTDYISENNSWKKAFDLAFEQDIQKPFPKYIDASFDTRDNVFWKIVFRDCMIDGEKEKVFLLAAYESPDAFKQAIYDWLNDK